MTLLRPEQGARSLALEAFEADGFRLALILVPILQNRRDIDHSRLFGRRQRVVVNAALIELQISILILLKTIELLATTPSWLCPSLGCPLRHLYLLTTHFELREHTVLVLVGGLQVHHRQLRKAQPARILQPRRSRVLRLQQMYRTLKPILQFLHLLVALTPQIHIQLRKVLARRHGCHDTEIEWILVISLLRQLLIAHWTHKLILTVLPYRGQHSILEKVLRLLIQAKALLMLCSLLLIRVTCRKGIRCLIMNV